MDSKYENSIRQIAEEIKNNKTDIVQLFAQKLKERIELPPPLENETLSKLIPKQIDDLIKSLIKFSASHNTIKIIAQEHGKIRASNHGYTLEILISEFIILKDAIFEVLSKSGPIDTRAGNLIWQYIVSAIKIAVSEFERQKGREVASINKKLDDSESLNESITAKIIDSTENEERYKTLVEGLDTYAVFTVDPGGYIQSWNPGAMQMKGYTAKEAIGQHFSMLYPDEAREADEPMKNLHIAKLEGKFHEEGLRRRKNGEIFSADVYIRPVYKGEKHLGFAKVVSDLTEVKKHKEDTAHKKTEIKDLKSEKLQREHFVTRLSHDLRGPLSITKAAVELAGRNMDAADKSQRFVSKALNNIDRMNNMIGDLLDANRIVAGEKPHLKLHDWNIVRLASIVCEDYKILGANIDLQTSDDEIKGEWDGDGIRRVLENLISNALKYGDNSYSVNVFIEDFGEDVVLKIHNMGEIIKEDEIKTLFDQYKRSESAMKNKKGWGIGLSLVKGIIEAHSGTIEVESNPFEGTTFIVQLPKHQISVKQQSRDSDSDSIHH